MSEQNKINIFIAGDSTVQTYHADKAPQAGWGQLIADYFTDGVAFHNHAFAGRSSKSFVNEGRLDVILKEIRPGDYLFTQMGHNDANEKKPERYTEPFTEFKHYLSLYIDGAREKGALPVLVTPMGMLHCDNGRFVNDFEPYCRSMRELAGEKQIKCIDLMTKSLEYYDSIGYDKAEKLFMFAVNGTDRAHFNEEGARCIARLVAEGIWETALPISKYLILNQI
jgi:lysophospholipase L1-like esterase